MSRTRSSLAVYFAAMGAELCVLYLGLSILKEQIGLSYLAFTLILLIYLVSLIFKMMAGGLIISRKGYLILTGSLGAALALTVAGMAIHDTLSAGYAVGGVVIQFVFIGLAWWLGQTLIREEFSYKYICFRLQVGILILLALAAAVGSAFPIIILFFILATIALVLAQRTSSQTKTQGILAPYQAKHVLIGGLFLFIPSLILILAVSPKAAQDIHQVFSSLGNFFGNLLGPYQPPSPNSAPEFNFSCSFKPSGEESGTPAPSPIPDSTSSSGLFFWLMVLILAILAVLLIALTIRAIKSRKQIRPVNLKEVEIKPYPPGIWPAIAGFFHKIAQKIRYYFAYFLRRLLFNRRRASVEVEAMASIRDIYRNFLRWSARQISPRTKSQTPLEYLKFLHLKLPQREKELKVITEVYIKARYSHRQVSEAEFKSARQAWYDLKIH